MYFTSLQAQALTGVADPVSSAKALLEKGENTKWVIVKMGEKGCLMITAHGVYQVPAFKVILDMCFVVTQISGAMKGNLLL